MMNIDACIVGSVAGRLTVRVGLLWFLTAIPALGTAHAQEPPKVTLGGQYRVNTYTVDNSNEGEERQTAARLRLRQSLDLAFESNLRLHLQVELGHTTSNITTTASGARATLGVRHAVIDYTFPQGINVQTGIVPLADNFNDLLFSSNWDYNPLAISVTFPVSPGRLRVFAGVLQQGSETRREDNLTHYQLDFVRPLGEKGSRINVGATVLKVGSDGVGRASGMEARTSGRHVNLGARARLALSGAWFADAALLGSWTNRKVVGTNEDGNGVGLRVELAGPTGRGELGVLGTWARGRPDGSGFLTPLAFVPAVGRGANSYWGYMGILTVQGPTDTGFDGDSVNVSNNGYGLMSLQGRYLLPIVDRFKAVVSAGRFGGTSARGRARDVGFEVMGMGTYRLTPVLALDFGAAYARLNDGLSGYAEGAAGLFNQEAGVVRRKTAFFSRLQAEF